MVRPPSSLVVILWAVWNGHLIEYSLYILTLRLSLCNLYFDTECYAFGLLDQAPYNALHSSSTQLRYLHCYSASVVINSILKCPKGRVRSCWAVSFPDHEHGPISFWGVLFQLSCQQQLLLHVCEMLINNLTLTLTAQGSFHPVTCGTALMSHVTPGAASMA